MSGNRPPTGSINKDEKPFTFVTSAARFACRFLSENALAFWHIHEDHTRYRLTIFIDIELTVWGMACSFYIDEQANPTRFEIS